MTMPSDIDAASDGHGAPSDRGTTITLSPEQIGLAATALIVLLGVSVIGPRIAELRRPKRPSLKDRARRAGQDVGLRTEVAGYRAGRRLRRFGGGMIRA